MNQNIKTKEFISEILFVFALLFNIKVGQIIIDEMSLEQLQALSSQVTTDNIDRVKHVLMTYGMIWITIIIIVKWLALIGLFYIIFNFEDLEREITFPEIRWLAATVSDVLLLNVALRYYLVSHFSVNKLYEHFGGMSLSQFIFYLTVLIEIATAFYLLITYYGSLLKKYQIILAGFSPIAIELIRTFLIHSSL